MTAILDIAIAISEVEQILERAFLITDGPPFFMIAEQEYARISVDGDEATLIWPEYAGGYYAGDGSIETQSIKFPAELLLMSIDQLKVWKAAHRKQYDDNEKAKREFEARARAAQRTAEELRLLAALKEKYDGAAN